MIFGACRPLVCLISTVSENPIPKICSILHFLLSVSFDPLTQGGAADDAFVAMILKLEVNKGILGSLGESTFPKPPLSLLRALSPIPSHRQRKNRWSNAMSPQQASAFLVRAFSKSLSRFGFTSPLYSQRFRQVESLRTFGKRHNRGYRTL